MTDRGLRWFDVLGAIFFGMLMGVFLFGVFLISTGAAQDNSYRHPPSPHQPGDIVQMHEYCKTESSVAQVVYAHAIHGYEAAVDKWEQFKTIGSCLEFEEPQVLLLAEQLRHAFVMYPQPGGVGDAQAVMEVWRAYASENVEVYVAIGHWVSAADQEWARDNEYL